MKKILALFAFMGLLFADIAIPITSLPTQAQEFIKNFDANVAYTKKDGNEFDVMLSDGHKITFKANGEWEEIENYAGVNQKVIPSNVLTSLSKAFSGVNINKIEREFGNYKVKLANTIKVYLDANGTIIGQQLDD